MTQETDHGLSAKAFAAIGTERVLRRAAEARIAELLKALEPFAEAACHLHPSQPDDGVTLDGIEVRHWRAAAHAFAKAH